MPEGMKRASGENRSGEAAAAVEALPLGGSEEIESLPPGGIVRFLTTRATDNLGAVAEHSVTITMRSGH